MLYAILSYILFYFDEWKEMLFGRNAWIPLRQNQEYLICYTSITSNQNSQKVHVKILSVGKNVVVKTFSEWNLNIKHLYKHVCSSFDY